MGFFAVLREVGQPDFVVSKLDINVWCLPSWFGTSILLCDVGVKLEVVPSQAHIRLTALRLAVPFGTNADELEDLGPLIASEREVANLIFGNAAPSPDHRPGDPFRTYDDGTAESPIALLHVAPGASRKVELGPDPPSGFSLWHIGTEPVPPGRPAYLRVRMPVRDPGRTWTWTGSALARSAALVDIRGGELREAAVASDHVDWLRDVVDIQQMNCFVVAPARYEGVRAYPAPKYVRLLEGPAWERYLRRAVSRRRREKLIVNFWQRRDVKPTAEFRGFLEMHRNTSNWLRSSLIGSAVAAAIVLVLGDVDNISRSLAAGASRAAGSFILDHVPAVTIVGVALVVGKVAQTLARVNGWFPEVRRRYRAAERRYFRWPR
jgi:hypothetical protein